MNIELGKFVLERLVANGVREFCVCPGKRNAPFVLLLTQELEKRSPLTQDGIQVYFHFEERSAAFFALGRIRATGRPVAVITTSGTAAGELLAATMEAHYTHAPLVLLTADRPSAYRGSGAPQSAEQLDLFGVYTGGTTDVEGWNGDRPARSTLLGVLAAGGLSWDRPTHINACFDEPLVDADYQSWNLSSLIGPSGIREPSAELFREKFEQESIQTFLKEVSSPVVLVGMLEPEDREAVVRFLISLQAPVYLEATSGLREDPRLNALSIALPAKMLETAKRHRYPIDGVIRLGGIPTLRLWRDLDLSLSGMPVLNLSQFKFTGLGRRSISVFGPLRETLKAVRVSPVGVDSSEWRSRSQQDLQRLDELIQSEPLSEPAWVRRISAGISPHSKVYLGNSMPIRDWDLAASRSYFPERDVWASRGMSGIDGQISTFIGFSQQSAESWGLFGDLTALYDLPGPWILSQLGDLARAMNFVVINNGGGKIFERMFPQKSFQNPHQIRFQGWAETWGLRYEEWSQSYNFNCGNGVNRVVEVIPDSESTLRFWKNYDILCG